jgi:hypothetical protein
VIHANHLTGAVPTENKTPPCYYSMVRESFGPLNAARNRDPRRQPLPLSRCEQSSARKIPPIPPQVEPASTAWANSTRANSGNIGTSFGAGFLREIGPTLPRTCLRGNQITISAQVHVAPFQRRDVTEGVVLSDVGILVAGSTVIRSGLHAASFQFRHSFSRNDAVNTQRSACTAAARGSDLNKRESRVLGWVIAVGL